MLILFAAAMAGVTALPSIDRASLDLAAKAEAARPARSAAKPVARAAAKPAAPRKPAANSIALRQFTMSDVDAQAAICRAAGEARDPVEFLQAFGKGYFLSKAEIAVLSESCAIYLAISPKRLKL